MDRILKNLCILTIFGIALTFLVWLPHILSLHNFWGLDFQEGFNTILRNFDGLEYVIIAKSFYQPQLISALPQSLPAGYFASHFPGYALLIYLFAPALGYLKSMLFVSLLSTILSSWVFYLILVNFQLSKKPLFLSLLFFVLPARWLIVHSIGSSEPTFILFVLTAVYFFLKFEQTKHLPDIFLCALFGALAQITRPPGILLFLALLLYIHYQLYLQSRISGFTKAWINHLKYFPLILIPFSMIAIFFLYSQTYQDFWAYFHSGDNIHLTFPPFGVFNKHQFWVGDIWLEDIVYIFLLYFLGGMVLIQRKLYPLGFFVLTYVAASTLVVHRDVSRYLLPISPFILIAFEKVLTSREFKIILPIILLAIYLYAQNFLITNTAPFPNPGLFN